MRNYSSSESAARRLARIAHRNHFINARIRDDNPHELRGSDASKEVPTRGRPGTAICINDLPQGRLSQYYSRPDSAPRARRDGPGCGAPPKLNSGFPRLDRGSLCGVVSVQIVRKTLTIDCSRRIYTRFYDDNFTPAPRSPPLEHPRFPSGNCVSWTQLVSPSDLALYADRGSAVNLRFRGSPF